MTSASRTDRGSRRALERRTIEEDITTTEGSVHGHERNEPSELEDESGAEDRERVLEQVVADIDRGFAPVAPTRRSQRPDPGRGTRHSGQPGEQHRGAHQQEPGADLRSADVV